MRTKLLLALLSLLLLSLPLVAQRHTHVHRDTEKDVVTSFSSIDPFGNKVDVVIDPPAANPIEYPWDVPGHELFRGFEVEEFEKFGVESMKMSVTVDVYAIADEEYRSFHSNWQNNLYQIIETADNAFWRDFQINWVIQGYYSWTSNGGNASAILSDLANDGSGLPNGLAMGFTRDSNFNAGGIAYVYSSNPGTGFSVCLDQGISSTTSALRHEIGHNYSLRHDFDPVVCLMNYTYAYSIDYFDATHENDIIARKSWFQ